MTPEETRALLAKAQLIDNRTVDQATIAAWHEAVKHLDSRDAMSALTVHRQTSTEYLQPAHIIRLARQARAEREYAEAKERAKRALPPAPIKPPPPWWREFRENLGREKPGASTAHRTKDWTDE